MIAQLPQTAGRKTNNPSPMTQPIETADQIDYDDWEECFNVDLGD